MVEQPSWRYWSGSLVDAGGAPKFGLMHAVFTAPGIAPFAHTSVVDVETGKVLAGDHEGLGVCLPLLPEPAAPKLHATTQDEYHASDKVDVFDVTLGIGDERYEHLDGTLWYDCERRTAKPGDGWRWISMRLDDGRFVMLYDHSNRPARYALRAEGDWAPLVARVVAQSGDSYESAWDVRFGTETFLVTPIFPGQEIVDERRGVHYLEALCEVHSGGKLVGSAYVEILPASKPVISKPSEIEMHLRWAQDDPDAAALIDYFGYATQLADDLVDLDREGVKNVKGRSFVMAEILYTLLIKIPGNPFFRKFEMHFVPLFTNCIVQWDASNTWAEATKKETRMFSYVTREATGRLVEQVAYLVGGFQWAKQVAREIHEYYHGAYGIESFEQWAAEGKGTR